MPIPYQINEIVRQLGDAFFYVGGSKPVYRQRPDESPYPNASSVNEYGLVDYETGIQFSVNIGRPHWKMVISLEPSDTYTVRLWKPGGAPGVVGTVVDEAEDVYCDELNAFVSRMYDSAINKYQGGFIHL